LNASREKEKAASSSLAVAIALTTLKAVVGILTNSLGIISEALHSGLDLVAAATTVYAVRVSGRPPDADHHYGHGKYETLASMAIAVALFLISFELITNSIHKLVHQELINPVANLGSFLVMGVTLAVNIGVMRYELKKGRELHSDFLVADSLHTGSDIFSSIMVIISLVSVRLGLPIIDVITGIIIALLIAYIGVGILKHSSRVLTDYAVIDVQEICASVSDLKEIVGCHRIRTRGRSDDIHVDLHVTVDKNMSVGKAHELSTAIEKRIRERFPGTTDVIVQIEPA
jgi:cation diffusion facilitator family transporter